MGVSFAIDPPNWADKLKTAIDGAISTAHLRNRSIKNVIVNSVHRHFRALEYGGSTEALGESVKWTTERHPLTRAQRRFAGVGRLPLLSFSQNGLIERAYTTGASITSFMASSRGGMSSSLQYFAAGGGDGKTWGEYNQLGMVAPARFFGRFYQHKYPARPFVFWDPIMVDGVKSLVRDTFEQFMR